MGADAHLDLAVGDHADVVGRLGVRRRTTLDRAVLEAEDRAVPRARDGPAAHLALVERSAAVRAAVVQRLELALVADEQDRRPVRQRAARRPFGQLRLADAGARPLLDVL